MRSLGPGRLHRLLADAEAVTWALLLLGMVLKYLTHTTDLGVSVAGPIHGFVFLAYCAVTLVVGIDQQWERRTILLGLLSAVLPFVTVPFGRLVRRRGLTGTHWRLLSGGARTPIERGLAAVLRRPVRFALVTLAALALVFRILLWIGPPGGA
ncbi:DUF3817 domain-containing protein [Ruania zhangjianzhongii]|uniref:DUF3817 domain-containing protein n=1 Tax=Ruania zhangjianzhongii TaxID=2603206 RepID=UPI002E273137